MFGKKFLLAVAAYVIGSVVATNYSEKKGQNIRADLEKAKKKGEDSKKILLGNFLEVHKNLLDGLKEIILTDSNKALFDKKVKKLKKVVKQYSVEWEKLLEELKTKGGDYTKIAKEELEKNYNEKKSQLEELKSEAPEKVEKMKAKLLTKFDEMKEKIQS